MRATVVEHVNIREKTLVQQRSEHSCLSPLDFLSSSVVILRAYLVSLQALTRYKIHG